MKLTKNHNGMPVFVGDDGKVVEYAEGVRMLRRRRGWSTAHMAEVCGVSPRTVEGWEQGRVPGKQALLLLAPHMR